MKTVKCLFPFLFLITLFWSTAAHGQRFAIVDYMKVPEGGNNEYVSVERDIWKPMHQEWVDQGKMESWALWRIPYPGGTGAEYHYATVQIFDDPKTMENRMDDMEAVFKKVHPGMDADKAFARTEASRDLVKTYAFYNWEQFGDTTQTEPSTYLTVVYFKIPMDKWDTYQEMEKKYFHPTHKAEIEAGCRSGWSGWQLIRPFGMDQSCQFVAVDAYKDWAQFMKPHPKGLNEKVLSADDLQKRDQVFNETAVLANLEEWRLVESTTPKKK